MSSQQYRSEMGIIADVLRVTMDCGRQGARISYVARSANLSHYTATEKCRKLVDLGLLIKSAGDKRNHLYVITEKGLWFFREMQKFMSLVREIKIRY